MHILDNLMPRSFVSLLILMSADILQNLAVVRLMDEPKSYMYNIFLLGSETIFISKQAMDNGSSPAKIRCVAPLKIHMYMHE